MSVPRDVLLDRLHGLLYDRQEPANPSDLQERLDNILIELLAGISRRSESSIPDDCGIVDGIESAIFIAMMEGIESQGLALREDVSIRIVRSGVLATAAA